MNCRELSEDIKKLEAELLRVSDEVEAFSQVDDFEEGKKKLPEVEARIEEVETLRDGVFEKYADEFLKLYEPDMLEDTITTKMKVEFMMYNVDGFVEYITKIKYNLDRVPENDAEVEFMPTVDDVDDNLERYLRCNLDLNSAMLVYVLKKRAEEDPESLERILKTPALQRALEKQREKTGKDPVAYIYERIKNLEVLETENFIWLLPKDKWDEEKVELPERDDKVVPLPVGTAIAPTDLTAILKKPLVFDWSEEAGGMFKRKFTQNIWSIYDEKWVGKEVRHFPWSNELLEMEEKLLRPNGYRIPEYWGFITNLIKKELMEEGRLGDKQGISFVLLEKYKMGLLGSASEYNISKIDECGFTGYYWSSTPVSHSDEMEVLTIQANYYNPHEHLHRGNAYSVRCVKTEE